MSRKKKDHCACVCHYHYMMPVAMAPMDFMMMPEMTVPFGDVYPMPDFMSGSPLEGNPHNPHFDGAFAGAFAGGPFFSPFFFPFFFGRHFFPFFPFFPFF